MPSNPTMSPQAIATMLCAALLLGCSSSNMNVAATLLARDLPIYDSVPITALEFSQWLNTGPAGVVGQANNGGWTCYGNVDRGEIGWSGLYFNGANDQANGVVVSSDPENRFIVDTFSDFDVIDSKTVEFSSGFNWTNARFIVAENTYPIFVVDDSRGFSVNCTRTNDVPEYA